MLVSLPVGRALLPESRGDGDGPWDVTGALMAAAGLFGVVLGVKRLGGGEAAASPVTVLPLLTGAALLVLFVRRQRRLPHPLVDLRMFRRPAFSTSVGCIVLAMLALVGLELIAAQYLQLVLGLSPLETGLRLLPPDRRGHGGGPGGRAHAAPLRPAPHGVLRLLSDGRRGADADRDGRRRQPAAAAGRLRAARLRPGDHAVRRVRVDAQRGPGRPGRRRRGDRRDVVPARRRDRHRAAGHGDERGLRAGAARGAGRAAARLGRGGPFARRGLRGRRPARRCRRGRPAPGGAGPPSCTGCT